MSRVIKFRAWEEEKSVMRKVLNICFHGRAQLTYHYNPVFKVAVEDCILEQFAGIHDSQGEEIYEGDILSDGTFVSQVRFSVDRYISDPISWKDGVTNLNLWLLKRSKAGCPVEVIGNIHENPELLEN